MTRRARILAWIETQDDPPTGTQAVQALGPDPEISVSIHGMVREGILERTGEGRKATLTIKRTVEPRTRMDPAEAMRRRVEREHARHIRRRDAKRAEKEKSAGSRVPIPRMIAIRETPGVASRDVSGDVARFLASGGQVQRLQSGDVSDAERLRFIGR